MMFLSLMLMALLIELAVGWPDRLYVRIRHPVVWMGSLISVMERLLNDAGKTYRLRQMAGAVTTLIVVIVSVGVACVISYVLPDTIAGYLIEAVVASSLFASRSLYQHVNAVALPL